MSEEATYRRSGRRFAVLVAVGLALWLYSGLVLALPGAFEDEAFRPRPWAIIARWGLAYAGVALALVSGYGLARRLEDRLASGGEVPLAQADPGFLGRTSTAALLIALGFACLGISELAFLFIEIGDAMTPVMGVASFAGAYVGPAVLTLGVYLALRRLESHLALRRQAEAPTASD